MVMRKFLVAMLLVSPLLLSGCSSRASSGQMAAPVEDASFKAAATQYSIEVAKARYVQRKCPELVMSFDGLMAELRSYPVLARSGGKMSEDSVDQAQVLAAINQFEAENSLRGQGQTEICAFGKRQMQAGTRTGKLLDFRQGIGNQD